MNSPLEMDEKLSLSLDRAFARLEKYFPEHKVFGLDALDGELREHFAKLYRQAGYATVEELFASRGFVKISGNEVRELRDSVMYTPGNEPDIIKNKVENILRRLEEYYPDRVIDRHIEKDHKNLGSNISGVYRWLGYPDMQSFLAAYGYEYNPEAGGRPEVDIQAMLDVLVEKYKTQPRPASIGTLIFENPEYKGRLKTFTNKCQELYGTTAKKYLQQIGVLQLLATSVGRRKGPSGVQPTPGLPSVSEVQSAPTPPSGYAESEGVTDDSCFTYKRNVKGQITITGYHGQDAEVTVPGYIEGFPVDAIEKEAFRDNIYLTALTLPDTVTHLYRGALQGCISLRSIRLSNKITKLAATTFNGCFGLKEVNIPDEVEELPKGIFQDAQLEKLYIGKAVKRIDQKAFFSGEYDAFTGSRKSGRALKELTVSPENSCFRAEGTSLLSADGRTLYLALGELGHYTVPRGVETIAESAFEDQRSLTGVTFPDSLTDIGPCAFAGSELQKISFGANLRTIGEKAFFNCRGLTEAAFAKGLEEIGPCAFQGCPIFRVDLPESLRQLAADSFDVLCRNSEKQMLHISQKNPWLHTDGVALYTIENGEKTLSLAYSGALESEFWGSAGQVCCVEEGTTAIAPNVFLNCSGLERIVLPEGLRSIGDSAFRNCNNLKSIKLPKSLKNIGNRAFEGTSIKHFYLSEEMEHIGTAAFRTGRKDGFHNHKIQVSRGNAQYCIEDNVLFRRTEDGLCALDCFGNAVAVHLPEGVSGICPEAFCRSTVEEVHIPASVVQIGKNAFRGCMKLKRLCVEFPEPDNGIRYAVVYLPGAQQENVDSKMRNKYMDCIQVGRQGTVFDFVKYDSLFPAITEPKDKILVATDRLKSAIQLAPLYREAYLSYLQVNAQLAVSTVVEFDDLAGLSILAELGVFTGENIDQVVELANSAKKPEIVGYLMNYKNASIGFEETDYEL